MRRWLAGLASVALLAWAGSAVAADDVANTKHNLASDSGNTVRAQSGDGADEICVFCHTPHAGDSTAPLWNRTLPSAGDFTVYSSDTLDMDNSGGPGPISLACLSCHDGATTFDSLINYSGSGTTGSITFTDSVMPAGITRIGTDLTDDHPVGMTYDTTGTSGDPAFNASGDLTLAKLYSSKVECASCHNPHEATLETFLRADNSGSALCLDCHVK